MTDKIRVLRVIEYTYSSMEEMALDMSRWTLAPTGVRVDGRGTTVRSSYMLPEFMPGDLYGEQGSEPQEPIGGDAFRLVQRYPDIFKSPTRSEAVNASWCLDHVEQYRDRKINMIKEYRTLTNVGLKESKDAVEAVMAWKRPDAPF